MKFRFVLSSFFFCIHDKFQAGRKKAVVTGCQHHRTARGNRIESKTVLYGIPRVSPPFVLDHFPQQCGDVQLIIAPSANRYQADRFVVVGGAVEPPGIDTAPIGGYRVSADCRFLRKVKQVAEQIFRGYEVVGLDSQLLQSFVSEAVPPAMAAAGKAKRKETVDRAMETPYNGASPVNRRFLRFSGALRGNRVLSAGFQKKGGISHEQIHAPTGK